MKKYIDNIIREMISILYIKNIEPKQITISREILKKYQPHLKDLKINKKSEIYIYGIPVKITKKQIIKVE